MSKKYSLNCWRLILGKHDSLGEIDDDKQFLEAEDILSYLFDHDQESDLDGAPSKQGGNEQSQFTVPDWINAVDKLFPQQAKAILEAELIQRKGIKALLEEPELLEKVEANLDLAKTLITYKNLLNDETRAIAQGIVRQVVGELTQKIKMQVEPALIGAIKKNRHSRRKVLRNLDLKTTIRRNLMNWDSDREQLIIDRTYFYAAERNARPWNIILGVDQSGSMSSSVIFSAIMASIFYHLPSVTTQLFVFDTDIADLTDSVGDPVDTLFKVQLGGGTDIAKAALYAQQLVRESRRTIFVLISDFYEGGNEKNLLDTIAEMHQSGVRQLGLAALGYDASPEYNRNTAKSLVKCGMPVLECTPEHLAECVAKIIS